MSMFAAYCLNGYFDNGTNQFVYDFPDFFHETLFWGCGEKWKGGEGRERGKEREGKEGRKVLI